ncbi:hypothetical protein G6F24_014079 [Rhizopus arrhizus]|nr:hypothetical protein G6F24_014079 [Rhizopus arrhizus]
MRRVPVNYLGIKIFVFYLHVKINGGSDRGQSKPGGRAMEPRTSRAGCVDHARAGPLGRMRAGDHARPDQSAIRAVRPAAGGVRCAGDTAPQRQALCLDAYGALRRRHDCGRQHDQPHRPAGEGRSGGAHAQPGRRAGDLGDVDATGAEADRRSRGGASAQPGGSVVAAKRLRAGAVEPPARQIVEGLRIGGGARQDRKRITSRVQTIRDDRPGGGPAATGTCGRLP